MNPIVNIRRNVLRLTQAEMASVAGVQQGTVSRWESGKLEPSLSEMRRIREEALARGLDLDDRLFFDAQLEAAA